MPGKASEYYRKYNYLVSIGNKTYPFQKVTIPPIKVEVSEYYEPGGTVIDMLGRESKENLILEIGASQDDSLQKWAKQVIQDKKVEKKDITINQLDDEGNIVKTWRVLKAYPVEFDSGEFDASSSDVRIEKLALRYEKIEI